MYSKRFQSSHLLIAILLTFGSAAHVFAQTAKPAPASVADEDVVQMESYQVTAAKEFSDIARLDKTPISFTEITQAAMEKMSISQDFLYVLQDTPSFYIQDGGGSLGDSTYTLRGFSQNNVSNMLNGIPINDLESGRPFAGNWSNLRDVASMTQVQRGISNITLTIPSVGGTINTMLISADKQAGGNIRFSAGANGTTKEVIVLNTGLLAGKFAATVSYSNYYTKGPKDGLYATTQGYFAALSYKVNDANSLELDIIAAPQRRGQPNGFPTNIAVYNAKYAREHGYTDAQLAQFPEYGMRYNQRYGAVDPSYTGKQYYWGGQHSRFYNDALLASENYSFKPQVNLNWYSKLSSKLDLGMAFFYLGGSAAQVTTAYSTSSSGAFAYAPYAAGVNTQVLPYDWNKTIQANAGNATYNNTSQQFNAAGTKVAGQSQGVLRNTVNDGNQYGVVGKLAYTVTNQLKITLGGDWRTSTADHYYEVRDLLGGKYYIPTVAQANDLDITYPAGAATVTKRLNLGDKFGYDYTGYVNWLGGFLSADYNTKKIAAFLTGGYGITDYSTINHFKHNLDAYGLPDPASEIKTTAPSYSTTQAKGGLRYNATSWCSPYINAGWASRAPVLAAAIDGANSRLKGTPNETFTTYEVGVDFKSKGRVPKFTAKIGYYWTVWNNQYSYNDNLTGTPPTTTERLLSSNYGGAEFDIKYKVLNWLQLNLSGAFSNWYYSRNTEQDTYDLNSNALISSTLINIKGIKVSAAPQSQVNYGFTLRPTRDFSVTFAARWGDRFYANLPLNNATIDATPTWRIPARTICDLNASYRLPIRANDGGRSPVQASVFVSITNIFDSVAVQYAIDNYYTGIPGAAAHSAQTAEVNLQAPLSVSGGIKFSF